MGKQKSRPTHTHTRSNREILTDIGREARPSKGKPIFRKCDKISHHRTGHNMEKHRHCTLYVDTSTQYPTIINWLTKFYSTRRTHSAVLHFHILTTAFISATLDFTYTLPAFHSIPSPLASASFLFQWNVTDQLALIELFQYTCLVNSHFLVLFRHCHKFFPGESFKTNFRIH